MHDLTLCRSLLFLPASNPRAIAKARESAADMILLDLEDAVREEDKGAARENAIAATREEFGRPVAIRVNPVGTRHFGQDVIAVRASGADFAVLAKAESAAQVHDAASLTEKPVLAMIETPGAVLNAFAIASATHGVMVGTNDLSAELRIDMETGRTGLAYALQQTVLAARAAGVAVFDGVFNRLEDEEGLTRECEQGRAFGFDGKTLIHPNQIAAANRIFAPDAAAVAAAERLIAAATGGAERFEGRMIESMHLEQARRVLARARVQGA